jgi:hypothetical protein
MMMWSPSTSSFFLHIILLGDLSRRIGSSDVILIFSENISKVADGHHQILLPFPAFRIRQRKTIKTTLIDSRFVFLCRKQLIDKRPFLNKTQKP